MLSKVVQQIKNCNQYTIEIKKQRNQTTIIFNKTILCEKCYDRDFCVEIKAKTK